VCIGFLTRAKKEPEVVKERDKFVGAAVLEPVATTILDERILGVDALDDGGGRRVGDHHKTTKRATTY